MPPAGAVARLRQSQAPSALLSSAGWELAALAGIIALYVVAGEIFGDDGLDSINFFGPIFTGIILMAAAWRMVAIDPLALFLGLFWFRVASAIYFGFGAVADTLFEEQTLRSVLSYFSADPALRLKSNLVCAAGLFIFLAAASAFAGLKPLKIVATAGRKADSTLLLMAVAFCLVGYSVKLLVSVPYALGAYGDLVIPAAIIQLTYLSSVGLFLLTLWCLQFSKKFVIIPTLLLIADIMAGLIILAKGAVMLPVVLYVIAWLRHGVTPIKSIAAASTVVILFALIVPLVTFSRSEALLRHGDYQGDASFSERLEILASYFYKSGPTDNNNLSWTVARFYYVPYVAEAVSLHDEGQIGNSLMNVFTIFIPRSLWKDKPAYNIGQIFSASANGNYINSTWMGIFGEAYWNMGWLGLPVVMTPLAGAYILLARRTISIMSEGKWLQFPAVLFAIYMGMRVDADIVEDHIVPTVICFAIYGLMSIAGYFVRALITQIAQK